MSFRNFTSEYLNSDRSSVREDLLGGLHTNPEKIPEDVLMLRLQHRMAGFDGVFGDNKDGNGKGDAFRFAMEYADEYGALPIPPTIKEETWR